MTISYSGNFFQLLARWKGSIWRLTWKELCIYLILYYIIRLFYTHLLPLIPDALDLSVIIGETQADNFTSFGNSSNARQSGNYTQAKNAFEKFALHCESQAQTIPVTFVLGFYVNEVFKRWWAQFECIPWPEDLLSLVCLTIPGKDVRSQKRRHVIARYINLTLALTWRDISTKIRRRFPTKRQLVECELLTEKEFDILEDLAKEVKHVVWLTPMHWIRQIILDEIKENSPPAGIVNGFVGELNNFRKTIRRLYFYDWVCIPLVYTQVTALATYAVFGLSLFGQQFLDPAKGYPKHQIDFYVPVFAIVQFLFYVGWLKVGQDLKRPFGMDDDDFELDYIFERNVLVSYAIVDRLQMLSYIEPEDKPYWDKDKTLPSVPPTGLVSKKKQHPPIRHVQVPEWPENGITEFDITCGGLRKKPKEM